MEQAGATVTISKEASNDSQMTKTKALVHMGPHKTGSSTNIDNLRKDGYEMPWVVDKNGNLCGDHRLDSLHGKYLLFNQANFAKCFVPPSARGRIPCNPDLLLSGLEIAQRRSNLFVSAEAFANLDSEGLKMLSGYLSHWDEVTIVVFYRRFYDWLSSMYVCTMKTPRAQGTLLFQLLIIQIQCWS